MITSTGGAGVKVLVHPAESHPRIRERALAVAPGTEAYIAILEKRISNMPKPYSEVDCLEDIGRGYQPKFGHVPSTSNRYNREACLLDCMIEMSTRDCGCQLRAEPFCTLIDFFACVVDDRTSDFAQCDCPYPCEYTEYDATLSTLSLPTPTYINEATAWNLTHQTTDAIRENSIQLKVYFSDLQITKISQKQAYTSLELISNLGGQLGLFLGASLISIGELVEFLIQACYYRGKYFVRRYNSSVKPSEEKISQTDPYVVQNEPL